MPKDKKQGKSTVNDKIDAAIGRELDHIMFGTYTDAQADAAIARIRELKALKQ